MKSDARGSRGLARKRHHLVRLALLTLGWGLLCLGFIGGLLPGIPGWPFGVAGAMIVYVESRWVQRKVRRFRHRHPKLDQLWMRARQWIRERKRARRQNGAQATK